jgi:hypothetical protein
MRFSSVFLLILWAGLAVAGEELSPSQADRDGDGHTSSRELVATGLFQRWDADGNGRLHAKEFRAAPSLFSDWDIDGNMQLSEDEFYHAAFRHLDRDGDRRLSPEELESLKRWR